MRPSDMDDTGLEKDDKTKGFQQFPAKGGAESGAVDDDLAKIIAIWSQLTQQQKAQISEFALRVSRSSGQH